MKKNIIYVAVTCLIFALFPSAALLNAQASQPDIIVSDALVTPENPVLGENFQLTLTLKNQGAATDRGFYITIRDNDDLTFIDQDYIAGSLINGEEKNLIILFREPDTLGFDELKNYHLKIDADNSIEGSNNNLIDESDESNNSFITIVNITDQNAESADNPTDEPDPVTEPEPVTDPIDDPVTDPDPVEEIDPIYIISEETGLILYDISATLTESSATLTWNAPETTIPYDGFALYISEQPFIENVTFNYDPTYLNSSDTSYTLNNISLDTTYYAKIYTYLNYTENSREFNHESETYSFKYEENEGITNFTGTTQNNSVTLQWDIPTSTNVEYFALYTKKDTTFTDADFVISLSPVFIPTNINTYTFYDLEPNSIYYFKIFTANILEDETLETINASEVFSIEIENTPIVFTDVENHWAQNYVEQLLNMGVVQGYTDGTFRPNNEITRAELVKVSLKANEIFPDSDYTNDRCDGPEGEILCKELFLDLLDWQEDWVYKAKDLGIITGYNENQFGPNNPITRAEALKVIIETFTPDYPNTQFMQSPNFTDIENHWALEYIKIASYLGIVQGYDDNTFKPNNPITRAEATKIISLLLE